MKQHINHFDDDEQGDEQKADTMAQLRGLMKQFEDEVGSLPKQGVLTSYLRNAVEHAILMAFEQNADSKDKRNPLGPMAHEAYLMGRETVPWLWSNIFDAVFYGKDGGLETQVAAMIEQWQQEYEDEAAHIDDKVEKMGLYEMMRMAEELRDNAELVGLHEWVEFTAMRVRAYAAHIIIWFMGMLSAWVDTEQGVAEGIHDANVMIDGVIKEHHAKRNNKESDDESH